ncbi:MAG: polysaccharide biosynthesis tyrosine autokinase [Tetrasphaera sp.]
MDLQGYLLILRKRWPIILTAVVIALAIAAALTALSKRVYESKLQFFVSTSGADDSGQLLQGSTFTQQRVKSYSQLIEAPKVLGPVVDKLGLDTSPEALAGRVSASVPTDTVLIDVRVTGASPDSATDVAAAVGEQFPKTVAELESVSDSKRSPVKVTVVQPATSSATPVSPRPARNGALALVLGLLVGSALAVARDVLDTSIKSEEDVKRVADTTILGGIPFDPTATKSPLVVRANAKSIRAEAFRVLRTNLRFVDATDHPRSLVVTSSVPGEGKTTSAANLALTLADAGSTVCIIEGDLRRPRLLEYFGMVGSVGLTDVLISRTKLDDVLQPFRDGLFLLGAGATPPNPSELLGSDAMRSLVAELEQRFDYVIIDSPPLLPVTDGAVLATIVDGVILVVGAGVAQSAMLGRALDSLESVNGKVLGILINRIARQESYRYGYYRYDYRPKPGRRRRRRKGASSFGSGAPEPAKTIAITAAGASPLSIASPAALPEEQNAEPATHSVP